MQTQTRIKRTFQHAGIQETLNIPKTIRLFHCNALIARVTLGSIDGNPYCGFRGLDTRSGGAVTYVGTTGLFHRREGQVSASGRIDQESGHQPSRP